MTSQYYMMALKINLVLIDYRRAWIFEILDFLLIINQFSRQKMTM